MTARAAIFLFSLLIMTSEASGGVTVAIVGLQDSRIAPKHAARADRSLALAIKKAGSLIPVPEEGRDRAIDEILVRMLAEELNLATDHYYHFRFQEAERLLAGRDDPEALRLKGLIAFTDGDEKKAEQYFIRLLEIDPKAKLSVKDYPPRLVALFETLGRSQPKGSPRSTFVRIAGKIYPSDISAEGWELRLRKFAQKMGWDFILLHRIEPIGWNYKISATLLSAAGGSAADPRASAVELVDLDDLPRASEILVKSLFIIDTSQHLK